MLGVASLIGSMILAQTPSPFDIVSEKNDPFNSTLLLNPRWGLQRSTNDSDRLPVVGHDCHLEGGSILDASAWSKGQSPCTTYPVSTTEGSLCAGHVNWFPIAYDGHLCWQDHHGGILGDDDYNFRVLRDDRALYTAISPKWVVAEFDSDETVDHYDAVPWWHHLHEMVDHAPYAAVDPVQSEICGKAGYIIGLVSFDTNHGGHAELHPVYAFAIHLDDSPKNDTWAFFVRNWGNQGGCAHGDYRLDGLNPITLFFPRTGTRGMSFGPSTLLATNHYPVRTKQTLIEDRGLALSITLPPPEAHAWVAGEVHLIWDESPQSLPEASRLALNCSWNGCWKVGKLGPPIHAKSEDDDEDWGLPFPVTKQEHSALERAVRRLDGHQKADYWKRYRKLRATDLTALGITRPVSVETIAAGTRPEIDRGDSIKSGPVTLRVVDDVPSKQVRQLEALCGALGHRIGNTDLCARIERLIAAAK